MMTKLIKPPRGRHWTHALLAGAATALVSLFTACGGVGEEGTGASNTAVSLGVLKGLDDSSVTINDITYDRRDAAVLDGFGQPLRGKDLRLGMWVEVRGTYNENAGRGVAQILTIKPAARGTVSSRDSSGLSVTVLDTTVRLAGGEVLEGFADSAEIAPGATVEVHGALDSAVGEVNATRIERLNAPADTAKPFELRGRVSRLDTVARTATIGRRTVSYANASIVLRSTLANGQLVRVSSPLPPVAGLRWAVTRLVPDQPLPENAGFVYLEGFVNALAAGPRFELEGLAVDASAADNRAVVTVDGQRIAVFGSLSGGILKAKSVALITPGAPVVFTLAGQVTGFVSPADFRVRGVAVDASAARFTAPATPAGLVDGASVRVVGTFRDRRLIASRIEFVP
jgi:Domain of unknown function (DUF5666)